MRRTQLLTVVVVLGLIMGSAPGAALVPGSSGAGSDSSTVAQTDDVGGNQATTGQQLATVIEVTDDEVSSDVEEASIESALENANESERAAVLADRAESLRERANASVTAQRETTTAYEAGNISRTEYAQRLAVLASRANTVDRDFDRLDDRAEEVSALALRSAEYDRGANAEARERLAGLTGPGTRGLLAQYTGERRGEFSLAVDDGLSIEVENDDGERSREFERGQPGNGGFDVNQSDALAAAMEPLSTDPTGEWTLRSVERDDDGYYEFAFVFAGPETAGEAEVSVDGETGEVFEFEEELEPGEDDNRQPLSVTIIDGTADPGESLTLSVTAGGDPVEGAGVEVNDRAVGETDADGQITVTLPDAEEAEFEVTDGDREGELELAVRSTSPEEAEDAEIRERLSVTGSVDDGTATVSVEYDGSGVPGTMVLVDDERVGTTDANGTASFDAPTDDELDVRLVRGGFEAEVTFESKADGTLAPAEIDVDERDVDEDDVDDETNGEANDEAEADGEEAEEEEEADEEDVDEEDTDEELSAEIVSGDPAPGATVTLEVSGSDGTVADAAVHVNGDDAGTTDADGQITVTLPEDDEVEIDVRDSDREGELEIEFEDETDGAEDAPDSDERDAEDGPDEGEEDENDEEEGEEDENEGDE
jgi:hypothetical protein